MEDNFEKAAKAIRIYMEELGWDIAVISGASIRTRGALEHNYELVFNVTATKVKEATK